jgi:hypothetical protein
LSALLPNDPNHSETDVGKRLWPYGRHDDFQGQARPTLDAAERARAARPELAGLQAKAVEAAGERYAKERRERAH